MGSPRWSRFLPGPADTWREEHTPEQFAGRACNSVGDTSWSRLLLKDCTLWEEPILGQFMKSCTPWEGFTLEKFVRTVFRERDLTLEQKSISLPPEEERAAKPTCDELTATPAPQPPALLRGEETEKQE